MFNFFYALLLICNVSANQCKVEVFPPIYPMTQTECSEVLEESLDKAFHYKDTKVVGTCVKDDGKYI